MKLRSMISYTSTVVALSCMPLLAQRAQAGPMSMLGQINLQFGQPQSQPQSQYQSNWNEDQRRELRHIYYRLEHANGDYQGHLANAERAIRRAAEEMGMDLHGQGYAQQWQGSQSYGGGYGQQPESQGWSNEVLQRSRDRLSDLANNTGDPVRHHLMEAVRELDRAMENQ